MTPQTITVGYADLDKFGAYARNVGYAKALPVLQEIMQAAYDLITKNGGRIHNHLGDGVLFVFTDGKQAVTAAKALGEYKKTTELVELRFLVSLATGEVFSCEIGSGANRRTEIFGDTVKKAFELHEKSRTGAHGLVMDETTKKLG